MFRGNSRSAALRRQPFLPGGKLGHYDRREDQCASQITAHSHTLVQHDCPGDDGEYRLQAEYQRRLRRICVSLRHDLQGVGDTAGEDTRIQNREVRNWMQDILTPLVFGEK